MSALFNKLRFVINTASSINLRTISSTPATLLKQIEENQNGSNLVIRGVTVASPREPYLIHGPNHACPICSLGLDVKHTDVLILSQFLRSDGCMLPRRITGLCRVQQKKVSKMVAMAQKAGLMPNIAPAYSKKDPKKRYQWKKFNTYFDESTIRAQYAKPVYINDDSLKLN